MIDVVCFDSDVDWIDGKEEPGELLWTAAGWSFVDNQVVVDKQRHEIVSGLDSQGCTIRSIEFDLQQYDDLDDFAPVAAFADRALAACRVGADRYAA